MKIIQVIIFLLSTHSFASHVSEAKPEEQSVLMLVARIIEGNFFTVSEEFTNIVAQEGSIMETNEAEFQKFKLQLNNKYHLLANPAKERVFKNQNTVRIRKFNTRSSRAASPEKKKIAEGLRFKFWQIAINQSTYLYFERNHVCGDPESKGMPVELSIRTKSYFQGYESLHIEYAPSTITPNRESEDASMSISSAIDVNLLFEPLLETLSSGQCSAFLPTELINNDVAHIRNIDSLRWEPEYDNMLRDILHKQYGAFPLHYAVTTANKDALIMLLDSGYFNINQRDGVGHTPLHKAVYLSLYDIIKTLLENNDIIINTHDFAQKSPFDLVLTRNDNEIIRIFIEFQRKKFANNSI